MKLSAALSAAAVIISLPQAVSSRPLSQSSGYPVVRQSNAGSLFCYMRTQRGVVLNLENLCTADDGSGSGNRATNPTANPAANPAANPDANTRVYRFIGTPSGDTTLNEANTGVNGNNPNGVNPNLGGADANTSTNFNGPNPGVSSTGSGVNPNTNNNFNGTNPGVNNTGNGINPNTNTNFNGTNPGVNNTGNGINPNTNTNTNFGGTNTNPTTPQ